MTELKPCPFCGGEPDVKYIGNDYTKTRKVQIKCKSCRVTRTDGAITHGHDWCYETAAKFWNARPKDKAIVPRTIPQELLDKMRDERVLSPSRVLEMLIEWSEK